jgi:hypothetical protein
MTNSRELLLELGDGAFAAEHVIEDLAARARGGAGSLAGDWHDLATELRRLVDKARARAADPDPDDDPEFLLSVAVRFVAMAAWVDHVVSIEELVPVTLPDRGTYRLSLQELRRWALDTRPDPSSWLPDDRSSGNP